MRAADFVLDYPASKYSHAMADLVRQLEAKPGDGGGAVIALTSAEQWRKPQRHRRFPGPRRRPMGKKAVILDCAPQRLASRAIKAPVKTGLYEVLTGSGDPEPGLGQGPAQRNLSAGHAQTAAQCRHHVRLAPHGAADFGAARRRRFRGDRLRTGRRAPMPP